MKYFKMPFIFISILFLFYVNTAFAMNIPVTWIASSDPTVVGYKVYYKLGSDVMPMNGTGAMEGVSPVIVGNVTTFTLHGLPNPTTQQSYFIRISSYDAYGEEGPVTASKKHLTVWQMLPVSPAGVYNISESVSLKITFVDTLRLDSGNLYIALNSGAIITITSIEWLTEKTFSYIVGSGQNANPLTVTDIYFDPNDPDVSLKDTSGRSCCLTVPDVNLDSDPNYLVIIDTIAPIAPTGLNLTCPQ